MDNYYCNFLSHYFVTGMYCLVKVSTESGHPVMWMEEKNYMFRLSDFKDQLTTWVNTGGECWRVPCVVFFEHSGVHVDTEKSGMAFHSTLQTHEELVRQRHGNDSSLLPHL